MLSINKTLYKKRKLELGGLVSTSVTIEDKVYTLHPTWNIRLFSLLDFQTIMLGDAEVP